MRFLVTVQPAVRKETCRIALGVGVLTALEIAVYLMIGRFSLPVLLGALLGAAFAVGNFFAMALSVQHAAEKMNGVQLPPEDESGEDGEKEEKPVLSPQSQSARRGMQLSYTGRMLALIGAAAAVHFAPCADLFAFLIPQLFPRIVIFAEGILMKKETQTK